jgi:hypothetical protein
MNTSSFLQELHEYNAIKIEAKRHQLLIPINHLLYLRKHGLLVRTGSAPLLKQKVVHSLIEVRSECF